MTELETSPMEAPAEIRSCRWALRIVFLVVFIDLLGFGIVLPLLPLYAKGLLEPLFPASETLRGAVLGLLMSSFSFMQFLFAPVWGRISDRVGRRPILLLGLVGSVVFYALFGIASEIGYEGHAALAVALLFVARIGAGIAGATISTAQAVIADSTSPDRRAGGMALIGAAFGIGFTFGPLLGFSSLFVPSKGAPGFVAAALSLLSLILAVTLLPETLRHGSAAGRRHWFQFGSTVNVLRMPTIGALVVAFFLATLAFGSLESTLALVNEFLLTGGAAAEMEATRRVSEDTFRKSFLIFAYVGLVLMLIQGLLYRRFVPRVGEVRFMQFGVALMIVGQAGVIATLLAVARGWLVAQSSVIPTALAILAVLVTGFALMTPSVQSLISRRADPARQGEVLGVNQSASALARILGPMFGATLFFTDETHVLPYIFGAGLMLFVLVLTLRLRQD